VALDNMQEVRASCQTVIGDETESTNLNWNSSSSWCHDTSKDEQIQQCFISRKNLGYSL